MKVPVTNDDGINSAGLHMLVKEVEKNYNFMVMQV